MIKFFDNEKAHGWYYIEKGELFGDGSYDTAIEMEAVFLIIYKFYN